MYRDMRVFMYLYAHVAWDLNILFQGVDMELFIHIYIYIRVYIYIYINIHIYTHVFIFIYISCQHLAATDGFMELALGTGDALGFKICHAVCTLDKFHWKTWMGSRNITNCFSREMWYLSINKILVND